MSTCADGAARPCRQPLLLAPLVGETLYGNIDNIKWDYRSLTVGMAIAGGLRPGVPGLLIAAFDAAVADLRRDAHEAQSKELLARDQSNTAMTWVSQCMKELAAQRNEVIDSAAAAAHYEEVIDWTVACASPRTIASSTSVSLADGVSDGQDLGTPMRTLGMVISTPSRQVPKDAVGDDMPVETQKAGDERFNMQMPSGFIHPVAHNPTGNLSKKPFPHRGPLS